MRRFRAPPERVFDAWLDPAMLGRWMFGPAVRDEAVVRLAVDGRVGGAFSFVVRRQGQEIDHVGTYLAIERPRRLAFTWGVAPAPPESRVMVDIVPQDGGCALALTHQLQPDWAEAAQRIAASWDRMLDALAAALGEEAS
jgi:uncharacterized protein YndB with AHSA1/START domain